MDGTSADFSHAPALRALAPELGRPDVSVALLMVELFDVSKFQARLGFAACARLLQALEEGITQALHPRGSVTRLGDGRFCVILQAIRNSGHAMLAAHKLMRVADGVMNDASLALKYKLNVGIALYPAQANDAESLLQSAQLAAAAARNREVPALVFDEACAAQIIKPWELAEAFARALDTGEISMFYQPKLSVSTEQTAGVEVLMRWLSNGKPVATPDVFIPLAEESGLIHAATWYAFSNALRLAGECGGLPVAVNITPGMLHHREFINMVRSAIATWGVREASLTLEVTEGGLIANFDEAKQRLKKLRDAGVRISIDDFGTGYSSLSYFKKIPADELKIDKSFIMNMMNDVDDQHLVRTILDLAGQFKLDTVAEGVEDRATFVALAEMGCQYVQGYLFAPALSAEKLQEWLVRNPYERRAQGSGVAVE